MNHYQMQQIHQNNHVFSATNIMKPLSSAQCNHVFSLLDSSQSAHQILSTTGIHTYIIIILECLHHPNLHKSSGGHPSTPSAADTHYTQHVISSGKAEKAV